jgi:hypothetical protein
MIHELTLLQTVNGLENNDTGADHLSIQDATTSRISACWTVLLSYVQGNIVTHQPCVLPWMSKCRVDRMSYSMNLHGLLHKGQNTDASIAGVALLQTTKSNCRFTSLSTLQCACPTIDHRSPQEQRAVEMSMPGRVARLSFYKTIK